MVDDSHPLIHVDLTQCISCWRCVRICEEVQGQFVWEIAGRGADSIVAPVGGSLGDSPCVACGACVDTCPTGALEDRHLVGVERPVEWTRTICPYCGVGCEMMVGTRDGTIVTVEPALDAPVNRGHLCVKGRYGFGFVAATDRPTQPMIREGSAWRVVSWPQALDEAARQLTVARVATGPDSVGVLGSARATNEDNYLVQKLARAVLGTNNVDSCARVCHAPSATALRTMLGTGAATNSFDDIEVAATFLVCGANTTENHPIVGARIKQAKLRGARLIVIDPRRIELASYADIHLQPRPGTNVSLLNALAATIVEEHLCDEAFVAERVEGFGEFRAFIASYSPEAVAGQCGVDAAEIRAAARLYATAGPAMCFHGLGVTEHRQGTEGVMALVNLALLTGNLGRAGSGVNPLRGQNNVQGAAHMGCEPAHLPGYAELAEARAPCRRRLGRAGAGRRRPRRHGDARRRSPTRSAGARRRGMGPGRHPTRHEHDDGRPGRPGLAHRHRPVPQRDRAPVRHRLPASRRLVREGRNVHELGTAGAAGPQGRRPAARCEARLADRVRARRCARQGRAVHLPRLGRDLGGDPTGVATGVRDHRRPARSARGRPVAVPERRTIRAPRCCTPNSSQGSARERRSADSTPLPSRTPTTSSPTCSSPDGACRSSTPAR